MKRICFIILIFILFPIFAVAQDDQKGPQREVTLYNVYKPSLSESKKRSFLPVINDTVVMKPDVLYSVDTKPFYPVYKISPLKAATLVADPLPKLYKSYVNLGIGNYLTPFAEISVTNERSKKGAIGLYARHFSTHGKVKMTDDKKVFAGYMDNDLSLFGKKFFKKSVLEGSIDYAQKTRYAYGYNAADTSLSDYNSPAKEKLRRVFHDVGGSVSIGSVSNDSSKLAYTVGLGYDLFSFKNVAFQQNANINAALGKSFGSDFYAKLDFGFDFYDTNSEDVISELSVSVAPSVSKRTSLWNFNFGVNFVYDKDVDYDYSFNNATRYNFYVYPDLDFGFAIMPSYMNFFVNLTGGLDKNMAKDAVAENPYVDKYVDYSAAFLYPQIPVCSNYFANNNTSYSMIGSVGFKGNNGIGGKYRLSGSYSIVESMLFFRPDNQTPFTGIGRYFYSLYDDVDIFNLHGEMDGKITDKLSFDASGNWYKYTLSENFYAPNKPDWDADFGLKYNLRDKILAGIDVTAIGPRTFTSYTRADQIAAYPVFIFDTPAHVNLNLSAEYRYTKILSFWVKANNIGFNKYYEYANYPTQRFLIMAGLTYSL